MMHYYQFNIGDYRRDTAHLSRIEHSIYRDLIDWYYLDEQPIPMETQSVIRRLRLGSDEEAEALQNVLSDFFTAADDGYHQSRIDYDIAKYHHECAKNKENGKKGGRPKRLQRNEENPVGSQSQPTGNQDETQVKANQEPITKNQETPIASHDKIVFDGSEFKNINGQMAIWEKAYPAVGVQIELNKAAAWIVANPKNRKTNYARFLTNWLAKAQDKAPRVETKPGPPGYTPPKIGDVRKHPTYGHNERFIGDRWVLTA